MIYVSQLEKSRTPAGDRLREFRQRFGLSMAKAAELTQTPRRTWEGWESEVRDPPACLLVLLDYIEAYGLPAVADPFCEEGGESPESRSP